MYGIIVYSIENQFKIQKAATIKFFAVAKHFLSSISFIFLCLKLLR